MRRSDGQSDVAVLIATRDRSTLLRERSLPSVMRQTLVPRVVVVVNDGEVWSAVDTKDLRARLQGLAVALLRNSRSPGVGGAWNAGIAHLLNINHSGFVAMLDDDDEWDSEHLAVNLEAAMIQNANIVVSGLRIQSATGAVPRPLIERLDDREFLTGNPGWQGSNTFVDIDLLTAVGGFRESLCSLHDRDLAIRLIRHEESRPALVARWTATWCIDLPGRLSDHRGLAKLNGLRQFWALYAADMSDLERAAFLERAERMFGFSADEVSSAGMPVCPAGQIAGDLHA